MLLIFTGVVRACVDVRTFSLVGSVVLAEVVLDE